MEQSRPSQPTVKQKMKDRGKIAQQETNGATTNAKSLYKVAPIIAKGLSNTTKRTLDEVLREKLPGVKIDNIIYNKTTKIFIIQPTDVQSYQQLLDKFPKEHFPNDKNPSVFVPSNIRQVIESESICFLKEVDIEYGENELRQALQNEGIQIKDLNRLTRTVEGTAIRKPTTTIKVICKDKKNRDTLIRTGLRISFCIFRSEPAKPNDIPVQCKRCSKFGHILKYCKTDNEVCARCSGQHATTECQSNTTKCSNCHSDHQATSKECPTYIEQQKKLKRTIEEFTTPIQVIAPFTSFNDYPQLSTETQKSRIGPQEILTTKLDTIADQLKATNELVQNLTTTISQLVQMQQAILTAMAQQLTTTTPTYSFQPPATIPTYCFPPPPPPSFSPDPNKRPAKQQKHDHTPQQRNNGKPYDCAALTGRPKRKTQQKAKLVNETLLDHSSESTTDKPRKTQTTITTADTTMEHDQQH